MLIFKKGVVNYFMSNLNVRVSSTLANNTKATIQAELDKIKDLNVNVKVNTTGIKSSVEKAIKDALKSTNVGNINLPSVSMKGTGNIASKYKTEYQQLSKIAREIGSLEFKIAGLDASKNKSEIASLTKQLNEFKRDYSSLLKSIGGNLSVDQWGKLQGVIDSAKAKVDAFKKSATDKIQFAIDVQDYDVKVKTIETSFKNLGVEGEELKQKMKGVSEALKNLKAPKEGQSLIDLDANFNAELDKARNNAKLLKMDMESIYNPAKQAKLSNDILNWLTKNTAASKEARQTLQQYYDQLQGGKVNVAALEKIQAELKTIDAQQRGLGKLGKNLKDQFKQAGESFTQWLSVSSAVMFVIQKTREAVGELKEIDNILTEISKTSDMTTAQLERLGEVAFESASKYGRKASDYLTGVQEMSRSGFYGKQGEAMAEQSLLAQAAGDMDANVANKYVLATNAAYKFNGEAKKLNEVLDGQNMITNRNSVSLNDMAVAMSEAGTTASSYRVSIEDLSAMIGTIESVTKLGGSEVGNAIKALLINLQNVTSDKIVETLDRANASMTEMVDGAEKLRNPIDILRDLAATFNDLEEDDPLRAEILTNIGQKYHATKLAALLQNMDMYDKMLGDYSEGEGSAWREAEKSANNLTGSLNKLSNTWTDTVENIVDSDTLKFAVNMLNSLLTGVNKLTDALGSLGSIGLGVGLFAGIKNFGRPKMFGFRLLF